MKLDGGPWIRLKDYPLPPLNLVSCEVCHMRSRAGFRGLPLCHRDHCREVLRPYIKQLFAENNKSMVR